MKQEQLETMEDWRNKEQIRKEINSQVFDFTYFQVAEWRVKEWEQIYAPLNVEGELLKMKAWLEANPRRRKKNYMRFAVGWLGKAHAKVVSDSVALRHSSLGRQAILTDKYGRYKVTAEGTREYIQWF